jgi:TonB family protein
MRWVAVMLSLSSAAMASVQAMAGSCPPALPGSVTGPAAVGPPHTCLQDYPLSAIRAGEEGNVAVGFFIKTDGTIRAPFILRSSGFPDLDHAALTCARRFVYKPAMHNGKPIEVPWQIRVQFRLADFPGQYAAGPSLPPPPPPKAPKKAKPDRQCIPVAALPGWART